MLRADVVMVEATCLVDRELDDLLRARSQADFADDHRIATTDDELDRGANLGQLNAHIGKNSSRDAITLTNQAKEQMLGSNVVVIEPLRLFLGQSQDFARPFCEFFEFICHRVLPRPPVTPRPHD